MSVRTINYTGRKRIERKHARIVVRGGDDGMAPYFDATLDLAPYKLPSAAPIFVEAYWLTAIQRFSFGTVGSVAIPEDRNLTEFGQAEGVLFRVKVVEVERGSDSAADPRAQILAHADQIRPDHEGRRKSLLPVEPGEFRDEVWQLHIDAGTGPLLYVSRHLARDWNGVVKTDEFVSLALPEILRRIMARALSEGEVSEDSWQEKWIRLGCQFMNQAEPPAALEEDDAERERWIDEVVAKFARHRAVPRRFAKWHEGGQT